MRVLNVDEVHEFHRMQRLCCCGQSLLKPTSHRSPQPYSRKSAGIIGLRWIDCGLRDLDPADE